MKLLGGSTYVAVGGASFWRMNFSVNEETTLVEIHVP